jgi:hypothetical protein
MGGVVMCRRCEWRGFMAFYFSHWKENHEHEGYFPAVKVSKEGADSRPRENQDKVAGEKAKSRRAKRRGVAVLPVAEVSQLPHLLLA